MDTSDDPLFWMGGTKKLLGVDDRTPPPGMQTSMVSNHLGDDPASQEQANRKRQKMLASVMTKDWEQPVLGKGGLVGL